ncbi:hypothetical protein EYF80_047225 [Liparis tanakae]|uniref:Uncharacterized protein n=1 Tax=Liparis tanakae TaxID=230148 RepID=A0A4Z2FMV2_9TELE|nr:hypothetical protein EYF80_047225 [Liparis tanakae]
MEVGLTAGGGEVIASKMVEVPTQATGGALVLLAHLQVDARASIPSQREAEHALHQQVVGQSLDEHAADRSPRGSSVDTLTVHTGPGRSGSETCGRTGTRLVGAVTAACWPQPPRADDEEHLSGQVSACALLGVTPAVRGRAPQWRLRGPLLTSGSIRLRRDLGRVLTHVDQWISMTFP